MYQANTVYTNESVAEDSQIKKTDNDVYTTILLFNTITVGKKNEVHRSTTAKRVEPRVRC
jgi:hypothetical protein